MRHYLLSMKAFSRRLHHSSVAAAAYRRRDLLHDASTGLWHDYRSRAADILSAKLYLPADAPLWAQDPGQLWSRNEVHNRRPDSLVAREILVAIPHELSTEQAIDLVGEFARYLAHTYRVAVDACIHRPPREGDPRNTHAHILLTTSTLTAEGFGHKVKELDPIAMRHLRNMLHDALDTQSPPNAARHLRPYWEELVNSRLASMGLADRVDCRSYRRQREEAIAQGDWRRAQLLERTPQRHLGPARVALLRKNLRRKSASSRGPLSQPRHSRALQSPAASPFEPSPVWAESPKSATHPPSGSQGDIVGSRAIGSRLGSAPPDPTTREHTFDIAQHEGAALPTDIPVQWHSEFPGSESVTDSDEPAAPELPPLAPRTNWQATEHPTAAIGAPLTEPASKGRAQMKARNPLHPQATTPYIVIQPSMPADAPPNLRTTFPSGGRLDAHVYTVITPPESFEMRDYGNAIVLMGSTGAQPHQILERLGQRIADKGWRALQFSGDAALCEDVSRILNVLVPNGSPALATEDLDSQHRNANDAIKAPGASSTPQTGIPVADDLSAWNEPGF